LPKANRCVLKRKARQRPYTMDTRVVVHSYARKWSVCRGSLVQGKTNRDKIRIPGEKEKVGQYILRFDETGGELIPWV